MLLKRVFCDVNTNTLFHIINNGCVLTVCWCFVIVMLFFKWDGFVLGRMAQVKGKSIADKILWLFFIDSTEVCFGYIRHVII